jgi:integrase
MRNVPYSLGWHDVRVKPSGKFEARWADENGRARGKCFMTKAQARKYAGDKARGILDASVGLAVAAKDITEAVDAFLLRRIKAESTAIYERHLNDFLSAMPDVKVTGHLTRALIESYDAILESQGHNPGGRRHIWKSLKTFCNFCIENNWLGKSPFFKLRTPVSDFEGRALAPEEYEKMISIDPRFSVDQHISRALRIGNPSMLRISQVWGLKPEDFREPGEVRLPEIKGQPAVWMPLHPSALAVVRELLAVTPPGARFFSKWGTVDAMRQSLRKKARRVGLPGVRFHDAGKVTRVSELDASGYGLGELSELSNTSKQTLAKHYIKADRRRVFEKYKNHVSNSGADEHTKFLGAKTFTSPAADLPQTYRGPDLAVNRSEVGPLEPIELNKASVQNAAQIETL